MCLCCSQPPGRLTGGAWSVGLCPDPSQQVLSSLGLCQAVAEEPWGVGRGSMHCCSPCCVHVPVQCCSVPALFPASSTGSAAWTWMGTGCCPCMSWNSSMRSSVSAWRLWALSHCPSRTCCARCWTSLSQRGKVSPV